MRSFYRLCSRLRLTDPATGRGVVLNHIAGADIRLTVRGLSAKAKVEVAGKYVGDRGWQRLAVAGFLTYVRVGYRAVLELGYNEGLETEFVGYVSEIEVTGDRVVLHLDDDFYPLKHVELKAKCWGAVTLREVLGYAAPGYVIDCPDLKMGAWKIEQASAYEALRQIKEGVGLYTRINSDERSIYCWWAYSFKAVRRHVYDVSRNVRRNGLRFMRKEDVRVRINAVAPLRSGKKLRVTVGSKEVFARVISRNFNFVDSLEELRKLADNELKTISFDGYRGDISGFGLPRTRAGDSLEIRDRKEPDRAGVYLIEAVHLKYGKTGFERVNTLSYRFKND